MTKRETNKLDKIAREKVRDDLKKCVICGNTSINIHHIEGRRLRSVRWYYPNLVALCPLHHTFGTFSAHQSPMRFRNFMVDLWGLKWEKDLLKQSAKTFKGNFQSVKDYLDGLKDNY